MAASDFGKFAGSDQTVTTASIPPSPPPVLPPQANGRAALGRVTVNVTTARVRVACTGPKGATCKLLLKLTVTEIFRRHRLISVTARSKLQQKIVVVGSASITLNAGESRTVRVGLNRTGKKLLAKRRKLRVRLRVTQTLSNGRSTAIVSQTVTFKRPASRRRS